MDREIFKPGASGVTITLRPLNRIRSVTGAAFAAEVVSEAIDLADEPTLTLTEAREAGAQHSSYRNQTSVSLAGGTPEPDLATFHREIKPILDDTCVKCHGPDKQKGDFRTDLLDPDLTHGEDVD